MTTPVTEDERKRWEGAETEYGIVREEILARIRLRQQIMVGTLTLGGVLLGVGTSWPAVALLYPPLAAFLAFAWAQNDYRVRDLANYVRTEVEPLIPAVQWESWINERRTGTGLGSWRYVIIAHGGLFLFTQALALYLGVIWLATSGHELPFRELFTGWMMVMIDIGAFITVAWILRKAQR